MRIKLLGLTAVVLAAPLLLSSCTAEPAPAEKAESSESGSIVREDQPEEVNAVENFDEFNAAVSDFVDLSEFSEDWLQIAPMEKMDEQSISEVWFAVVDAETAITVSNALMDADGWTSAKVSAPQTPEEQIEAAGREVDEDPLDLSGVFYLDDGSSMSVSVFLDESNSDQTTAQYMFSVNRV